MGTADYCALVALLLGALIALSIHQEECRCGDRRQRRQPPPDGVERRSGPDRREGSFAGWTAWALRSLWRRLTGPRRPAGR